MMKKIDVRYLANLARLDLTDEEVKNFSGQLGTILSYIEKLKLVDTKDTPPTTHPLPIKNVFREDIVRPSLPASKALRNAPDKQGDSFKVPKVIEGE